MPRRSPVAVGTVAGITATVLGTAAVLMALFSAPAQAAPTSASATRPAADTQPHFRYANSVRESVWVRSSVDSDNDGRPDRIAVDIVRPRTRHQVPVILEASPYYTCCGRGNQYQFKTYDRSGVIRSMPLYYDNYFVPRGYAFVAVDLPGTGRSTGCPDLGGPAEVGAVASVIHWLTGKGVAREASGVPVSAWWSTGAIGMIGKSWDATIANAMATTGIPGLRTVVDISGISSWYDYERFNGVLRYPRQVYGLGSLVDDRHSVCAPILRAEQREAADGSANFTPFWAARDYRLHANRVTASVFVVHGLNDLNVTTPQFAGWWSALAANDVPRKIWLSQDGHVDPFDFRRAAWVSELHRWFDHWLLGRRNGIMAEPQASIQQPDGRWTSAPSWPVPGAVDHSYGLSHTPGVVGRIGIAATGSVKFTDHPNLGERRAVARPRTVVHGRAAFVTFPMAERLHISGSGSVQLRVRIDQPDTELTARVVDYGLQRRIDYLGRGSGIVTTDHRSCWGESSPVDSACYLDTHERFVTDWADVLARGWLDAAHRVTLVHRSPLTPGTWYDVTVPLAPIEDVIAAGHRLGLVLTASDTQSTDPTERGALLHIDLSQSALVLPLATVPTTAGGPSARVAQ